ncbi:hypothetical protein CLUG_01347 [Clavispora lusitaniae ATCC 42720]|uniref:Uncharacterized protein n=1 Tax=Clavispora lusitaniae (strain ATCC 42720) TaxID=306902 RepID=C4XZG5_CLAL4|nr:uncharacterized protein CLUG_01347 [Clavispora lusitaniae ATCC 42720]EEQ37223.1 hypothetical protein CLUG_01347 [Clavispora lusitaniae ATCC 42720]
MADTGGFSRPTAVSANRRDTWKCVTSSTAPHARPRCTGYFRRPSSRARACSTTLHDAVPCMRAWRHAVLLTHLRLLRANVRPNYAAPICWRRPPHCSTARCCCWRCLHCCCCCSAPNLRHSRFCRATCSSSQWLRRPETQIYLMGNQIWNEVSHSPAGRGLP